MKIKIGYLSLDVCLEYELREYIEYYAVDPEKVTPLMRLIAFFNGGFYLNYRQDFVFPNSRSCCHFRMLMRDFPLEVDDPETERSLKFGEDPLDDIPF